MSANNILGEVKEDEIRTFSDNLFVELTSDKNSIAIELTRELVNDIVDLILERATELFEAHARTWMPGSAFPPHYIAMFLRGLKTDENNFNTKCQSDPSDSQFDYE